MSEYALQSDIIQKIKTHLANGGKVQITTYTRSTMYDARHIDGFKVGRDGSPLVQRGRAWDDFRYASVRLI